MKYASCEGNSTSVQVLHGFDTAQKRESGRVAHVAVRDVTEPVFDPRSWRLLSHSCSTTEEGATKAQVLTEALFAISGSSARRAD